jgi:hypothetical protein
MHTLHIVDHQLVNDKAPAVILKLSNMLGNGVLEVIQLSSPAEVFLPAVWHEEGFGRSGWSPSVDILWSCLYRGLFESGKLLGHQPSG